MPNTVFAPLDYYSLIKVSGADAQAFLQNQLSNDINQLCAERSQLSSYSSAKGMMFASLRVIPCEDGYLLRIANNILEPVIKRLGMFVLRDDIQLSPAEDFSLFGLAGPDSLSALSAAGFSAPANTDDLVAKNNVRLIRCISPADEQRFELIVPSAQADQLNTQFAEYTAGSAAYLEKQLRSGEAFIEQTSYEQFVAQNLNLELINGVSFKKGCYPGQEYIARTQYRGQVRSRTYLISANADMPAGTELFESGKEEAIGKVLNSTGKLALAVIRNKQAQKQSVCLAQGEAVQVLELPYSLETEES